MKKMIKLFHVPGWLLTAALGVLAGLSIFTFLYAEGPSYFSHDPAACVNCHIMRPQFDAWNRSSHKAAATCNECHTPKNPVGKYAVKAINGWNHSVAFTTNRFQEPIQIKRFNRSIVLGNCTACHRDMVQHIMKNPEGESLDCISCHRNVGHDGSR